MMKYILSIAWLFSTLTISGQELGLQQYKEDFDFLWKTINENYAYWDKKQTDWQKVNEYYSPRFDSVHSRKSFVLLLEKVLNELYDHHAGLNTNTPESQRLVPTGTDIWAAFVN